MDCRTLTGWAVDNRALLRALGYDPEMPPQKVHALLHRGMASPGRYWYRGVVDYSVIGYAWMEVAYPSLPASSIVPVVSFVVSPQHQGKWGRPFGLAALSYVFRGFDFKRLMAKIPVTATDSAVRTFLSENSGSPIAFNAQTRLGFRFTGYIPMVLNREDFIGA